MTLRTLCCYFLLKCVFKGFTYFLRIFLIIFQNLYIFKQEESVSQCFPINFVSFVFQHLSEKFKYSLDFLIFLLL